MATFKIKNYSIAFASAVIVGTLTTSVYAQEDANIEEVVVTGSQIKGAKISDALAVSVISADDIEAYGIDSGDELLALIPENGQNFFNEAGSLSGGVNAARGDIGAYNLRSLGTGNTLSLLNGRRVVNSASFQTEIVGGSFVPVNTANTNAIPVRGVERIEVLRDGASAIYGADAVAGVINTVLKTDFEGLDVRLKWKEFDNIPRDDQSVSIEWGKFFNDERTNVGVFFDYFSRDNVNSQDDPRWSNSDFRSRIPAGSPFSGSTAFRNNSANSLFGQFDVISSVGSSHSLRQNGITDRSGEFEVFPVGDSRCTFIINNQLCGAADGNGVERFNLNANRDLVSALDRYNVFMYINHEFENGMESFTEVSGYRSETKAIRHPTASQSSVKLRIAADNFYNPLGPCGSIHRLPDSVIGTDVPCTGLALQVDNYRFAELPRIVENDGDTFRLLQGFRGDLKDWSWESAAVWSRSEKSDTTHNRVSNTLIQEALNDTTAAAYNHFAVGVNSNIERALISVRRDSEAELFTWDAKFSTNDLFDLPAGSVAALLGVEFRRESFDDDRDPRLDGTIRFVDNEGDTFPFVSDVVNSSPTSDNSGSRRVWSAFGELQIPVTETLDVQLALRHENFSDVESTTVSKLASGWRPLDILLIRGSYSQAFRAPNLVTLNESLISRTTTVTDSVCEYAAQFGGDPNQNILDCDYSAQRGAQGSDSLEPEKTDNFSIGFVLQPIENLTVTADYWSIEKTDTIGLFGTNNHTTLDLVARLENGLNNCNSASFNALVERDAVDPATQAIYDAAGICAAGDVLKVGEQYVNLDKRTVTGVDLGIYYDIDTRMGQFNFKYNASFLEEFEQIASGDAAKIVDAQNAGVLPQSIDIVGYGDVVGRDGNQDYRHNMKLSWRHRSVGASVSWNRIGDFYQSSLTLADGTRYEIPAFDTYDATFDWRTELSGKKTRFRLGVKNLTDERAPLADGFFGYFEDAHSDLGRYVYLDAKISLL